MDIYTYTRFGMALGFALMTANANAEGPTVAPYGDLFPTVSVLEDSSLDTLRGRDGDTSITVQNNQSVQATVNGSMIEAGTINSGSVTFSENALDNFSGVGLFNVVTGNNNAVDAAIGVTINLQ